MSTDLSDAMYQVRTFLEEHHADAQTMDAFDIIRNGFTKVIMQVHAMNSMIEDHNKRMHAIIHED